MNKLNKIDLIIEVAKENNITAYEIGKNTNLSTLAIQNILNGKTKNPTNNTIDIILEFLENAIVGTNVKTDNNEKNCVNENSEKYLNHTDELIITQKGYIETQNKLIKELTEKIKNLENNSK